MQERGDFGQGFVELRRVAAGRLREIRPPADGVASADRRWPLTGLQQRLVKTDGRLFKHARYYWLLLAEGNLTRRLFGSILQRIAMLAPPAA